MRQTDLNEFNTVLLFFTFISKSGSEDIILYLVFYCKSIANVNKFSLEIFPDVKENKYYGYDCQTLDQKKGDMTDSKQP